MSLKLYNTPTRSLEDFKPAQPDDVRIYSCGPTVYDDLHIGNWAAYIYWDVLVRILQANDYNVNQVINITDVGHLTDDGDYGEDKLEASAQRKSKTAWDIADIYSNKFTEGRKLLNMLPPTHFAKATDYIPEQLNLAKQLYRKDYLYKTEDGLYFDTSKFTRYKDFANLKLDEQQSGEREIIHAHKRQPSDFAVWKFSPTNKVRDMEWETPPELLGQEESSSSKTVMGFPGWHLECSAIALTLLGETLDIHTGGIDHIPVHHTNEIAQTESVTNKKMSRFWLHNNHMKSNGTKISKSLRNGYTLDDILKKGFTPMQFRMLVLQSHYRTESNFSFANLKSAANRLKRWERIACLRHQSHYITETLSNDNPTIINFQHYLQNLLSVLNEDLGTPEALSFIDKSFSKIESNKKHTKIDQQSFNEWLHMIDSLLGLKLIDSTPDIDEITKQTLLERAQARKNQDWNKSDQIRNTLLKQGITVTDTQNSTTWFYS